MVGHSTAEWPHCYVAQGAGKWPSRGIRRRRVFMSRGPSILPTFRWVHRVVNGREGGGGGRRRRKRKAGDRFGEAGGCRLNETDDCAAGLRL